MCRGRGEIDDAAAAVIAFALRQGGLAVEDNRRADAVSAAGNAVALPLICYASHPSEAVRRYNLRKLRARASLARHAVIDYEVEAAPNLPPGVANASAHQMLVGDIAAICRLAAEHALEAMNPATRQGFKSSG